MDAETEIQVMRDVVKDGICGKGTYPMLENQKKAKNMGCIFGFLMIYISVYNCVYIYIAVYIYIYTLPNSNMEAENQNMFY